jgi:hypothetical protein
VRECWVVMEDYTGMRRGEPRGLADQRDLRVQ